MKAKTVRPLLIVLLFGVLSSNGWLIVQGSGESGGATGIPSQSRSPHIAAHGNTLRLRGALPASSAPAGLYMQHSAPSMLNAATTSAGQDTPGALHTRPTLTASTAGPTGVPAHDASGVGAHGQGDALYQSSDSFGEFGIAETLSSGEGSNFVGAVGRPGGASGTSGGSGGSSGTGPGGLLDPPGATGGSSPGGSPTGTGGNPVPTVPEPPAAALLLAGLAALGWALRKLRRARD